MHVPRHRAQATSHFAIDARLGLAQNGVPVQSESATENFQFVEWPDRTGNAHAHNVPILPWAEESWRVESATGDARVIGPI